MRGSVLGYNFHSATGDISGDDGERYAFSGEDWNSETTPAAGQEVDFRAEENIARGIYPINLTSHSSQKSAEKIAAGLLALFLGTIGIHKFYLGYRNAGLVMLCVAIFGSIFFLIPTLIMAIIAFVEAIIYLSMSDQEWHEKYVENEHPWF